MEHSPNPIRVVLADDHHLFREGLRGMLQADGMQVVGEAADGKTVVALTRELTPDVVVVDLRMPGASGIEALRAMIAADASAHVIVLTVSVSEGDALQALADGACSYLLKDTQIEDLVASIRLAARGHGVLSREILRALAVHARDRVEAVNVAEGSGPRLTPRELEVIRLISEGADNAAIGRELSISRHTVKQHVTNLINKLGVENRVQAAVHAVRAGLV